MFWIVLGILIFICITLASMSFFLDAVKKLKDFNEQQRKQKEEKEGKK